MSTPAAAQPALLARPAVTLPVVDRNGLRGIVGRRGGWVAEAEVRVLGTLNIAMPQAKRRELRFPTEAVQEYLAGAAVVRTDEALAALIFGQGAQLSGVTTSADVVHRLMCKPDHFFNLAEAGEFPGVARPGPGRTATLAWPALVAFVSRRRIT